MLRVLSVLTLLAVAATAVFAQNVAVIKERKAALKAMGDATKEPGKMLKGEMPFDLAKVKVALKTYQEKAPLLPDMFPEDSKKGEDTEALPKIWQNKKDFSDRFMKLAADAKAAEPAITDEISFTEEFPKVVGSCGGCHKQYRLKK